MNERPYLSIGEVLGLLLEEFPDITISKIRFLESQGLIEPERTASGYRKFFDADVERLKVILREQRENFLPLRVIRDLLESRSIDDGAEGGATPPRGLRNVRLAERSETGAAGSDNTDQFGIESFDVDTTGRVGPFADQMRTNRHPAAQLRPMAAPAAPAAMPTSPAETIAPVEPAAGAPRPAIPLARPLLDDTGAAVRPPAPAMAPPVPVAAPPVAAAVAPVAPAAAAVSGANNAAYDRAEICAAAGITAAQLAELESYGLVVARGTGSNATYTEGDLAIVRPAAGFLARGIDARHLRAWRQSAEREASLFEQRILPLLRQRNPQARHDANELLNELAGLGAQLREAIVLGALRHHLEP